MSHYGVQEDFRTAEARMSVAAVRVAQTALRVAAMDYESFRDAARLAGSSALVEQWERQRAEATELLNEINSVFG